MEDALLRYSRAVTDHVRIQDWDFEVVDLDGRRIDKVLARRATV